MLFVIYEYVSSFVLISVAKVEKSPIINNNSSNRRRSTSTSSTRSSLCNSLNDEEETFFHHGNKQQRKRRNLSVSKIPNKPFTRTMQLHRPVGIIHSHQYDDSTYQRVKSYTYRYRTQLQISTGLTFDDGDQLLVSAQKPLGMVLEELDEEKGGCIVVSVGEGSAAEKAGVKEGDLLVAVQNADVGKADLDEVMGRIIDAPRVVNLRFWRRER